VLHLPHQVSAALLLAASLAACSGPKVAIPVYPPAPEQPRFIYETVLATPRDLDPDSMQARLMRTAGADPLAKNNFVKPLDVAARQGRVYVTDTLGKVVHVFDAERGRYFRLGFRREGQLVKPVGVAVDGQGNVYVADSARRSVVKFDNFGLYLADIGKDSLRRPIGVAVSPDGSRVYAVEADGDSNEAHGIVAFDQDGKKVFETLARGGEPGQFNLPVSAAVGKDGAVYVLDAGNFRVQKLSPEGKVVKTWGGVGNRSGQMARPRDIATDSNGNVYVSDSAFGAIQMFDPDGRLLMDLGEFGLNGNPGEFAMLAGIGIDETGRIYAVDQVNRAVTVFRPMGS